MPGLARRATAQLVSLLQVPPAVRPDLLLDTQPLAPAEARRAGAQLLEGTCSLTWLPPNRQMDKTVGRSVQLPAGLPALRSGGEAL